MASHAFTRSANEDLIGIRLYTREAWGEAQADRYQDELHRCCERIAAGTVRTKSVSAIDRVQSYHCRHHYLFFVEQRETIVVIAVSADQPGRVNRLSAPGPLSVR